MRINYFFIMIIETEATQSKSSSEEEIVEVTSTEEPRNNSPKVVLPKHSITPPLLSSRELLHESATKLLFLALKWVKTVPSFTQLPFSDQKLLIDEAWAELFVLTAAQWGLPIDCNGSGKFSSNWSFILQVSLIPLTFFFLLGQEMNKTFIKHLQNAIHQYQRLRIDPKEAACLKALILFKPNLQELTSYQQCVLLQEQTLSLLHKSCIGGVRFGHLLMLLLHVKAAADVQSLKEIFFRAMLGENGIERAIYDTLKH